MSIDSLTMNIEFDINDGKFKITGDINEKGQYEIIETFIRGQIGAGKDNSKPNVREVYHISLQWYPSNDDIVAKSDTGNKGLRDGILMDVFRRLDSKKDYL